MHFEILTLFPNFFESPLKSSILGKAKEKGVFSVHCTDIRDFSFDKNKKVDDTPYGGGAGMLMRCDVVANAIRHAKSQDPNGKVIFFSPTGEKLTQKKAKEFADEKTSKILLCGHYEGIDERVIQMEVDEVICVGDTVFTGGEIPALAFLDSVVRLLPDAIGKQESHENESFSLKFYGRGEYPHYTRPEIWESLRVPQVLLSGNHAEIQKWRIQNLRGLSELEEKILSLRQEKFSPQKPWKTHNFLFREHIQEDILHWMNWVNDEEVTQFLTMQPPLTKDDEEWFFEWTYQNLNGLFLTLLERKTKEYIGNISLEVQVERPHIAKLGLVIGNKNYWGKGIATKAVKEIINIGFEDLKIEKIELDVFCKNEKAIRVYEKCGFQQIGRIKKFYFKNGSFQDVFLYEILKK